MRNIAFWVVAALMLIVPVNAEAQKIEVSYTSLIGVMSGYHGGPGADYWAKLDPELTRSNLIKIVGDPAVFTIARSRALHALTYFVNGDVVSLLIATAKTEPLAYLRATALEELADVKGDEAIEVIGEGLKDKDVMVRLSATRSLSKIGGGKARALLEQKLQTEENPVAKSVVNKTLKRMP